MICSVSNAKKGTSCPFQQSRLQYLNSMDIVEHLRLCCVSAYGRLLCSFRQLHRAKCQRVFPTVCLWAPATSVAHSKRARIPYLV